MIYGKKIKKIFKKYDLRKKFKKFIKKLIIS